MAMGMGRMMMRPGFDIFGIESLYFLVIAVICLIIYFKTKELYDLTKHQGIYHFRNIFLYFSLAYFFRLSFIIAGLSRELFLYVPPKYFMMLGMVLTTYASVMAILSIAMSIAHKHLNAKHSGLILHLIAAASAVIVFATRSQPVLLLVLTVVFLASVVYMYAQSHSLFSKNKVTYLLLLAFWILNVFTGPRLIPIGYSSIIYSISIAIFLSILIRVNRTYHGKA